MKTKLSVKKSMVVFQRACKIQERLEELSNYLTLYGDIELNYGNGNASEQLECAICSLECIIQDFLNS